MVRPLRTLTGLLAAALLLSALPSASADERLETPDVADDVRKYFEVPLLDEEGDVPGGTQSCYGPNPPPECYACDPEDPDKSEECWREYCAKNPDAYTCTHNAPCEDGFIERDTDRDGECDHEESDDDNDGVPDSCDPNPRSPKNPLTATDFLYCTVK